MCMNVFIKRRVYLFMHVVIEKIDSILSNVFSVCFIWFYSLLACVSFVNVFNTVEPDQIFVKFIKRFPFSLAIVVIVWDGFVLRHHSGLCPDRLNFYLPSLCVWTGAHGHPVVMVGMAVSVSSGTHKELRSLSCHSESDQWWMLRGFRFLKKYFRNSRFFDFRFHLLLLLLVICTSVF